MKNFFYLAAAMCFLSLGFNAQTATAQYSFGDDVDSIEWDSDGGVKLQDSVDTIKVDQIKTDANGNVELKNVEVKGPNDSIKVNSVKTNVRGEVETGDTASQKDTTESDTTSWEISIDAKNFGSYVSTNAKLKNFSGVQNANDLKAYIANKMQADTKIESVEMEEGAVKVEYKMPGKILALIPVNIPYKISVDTTNNVSVRLPWWHIFATKAAKAKEVNAAIQSEVSTLSTNTSPAANVELDATGKIKIQAGTFSAILTGVSVETN